MIHIHPFPARMAPEIALTELENLPKKYTVLDPMSGSGMVLGTAARLGLKSYGYDIDPLACMISRVNGTHINEEKTRLACKVLIDKCRNKDWRDVQLPWIDTDRETVEYIRYWFALKQKRQLRILSHFLVKMPFIKNKQILDALKISISRLIISKEPKASLARDTAHSRPHKTISTNDFDILEALPQSLNHVLKALETDSIQSNVKAYRGDARRLGRIQDKSIDCIVTSPPYLNAIDYMRGHRLSLIWWGYDIHDLRRLRSRSVGAEKIRPEIDRKELNCFLRKLHPDISENKKNILKRYYQDLCGITDEAYRVLKRKRCATYIIGDSMIKGHEIHNSELLIMAARNSGFYIKERYTREIPQNKRYMPISHSGNSGLSKRMKSEHIIVLNKR